MLRYHAIDNNLFITNRKKLIKLLKPNAICILNANDIMPQNGDGVMAFRQNSDLFYLSGIDQEETILVLFPDAPKKEWKEMLFIKSTNEAMIIWEGQKYTPETAHMTSGIASVHFLEEFESIFRMLMAQADDVYLNSNEHTRSTNLVQTRDTRFINWCKSYYPLHHYQRLAPLMTNVREIKSALEIELIKKACDITEKGFRRILPFIKPGVIEYEIEAEFIHEFIRNRSRGFAYEPIIAAGKNACILHYCNNNQLCKAGQTILLDVGAEYANYASDMTRVVPVSGSFTKRQRTVYDATLRIMQQAKQLLILGNTMATYQQAVIEIVEKELIDLRLISLADIKQQDPKRPAYKKYFMHGVSHHLGLGVHDLANMYTPFAVGMVLTIEPGIYIPEEELGIRLENNVIIREDGVEDLMANIPIQADEIEALMNAKE
jgi:Xaa-Pro aminopeptidase